jgi:biotin transport system substrate-specific component
MVTAALVTALLAASAWIIIPVGAVPITLQVFFVVLAALLLPPVWAAASMAAYLALGAVGLPIFSGGQGGPGVIAGPTGGYLLGFLVGSLAGAVAHVFLAGRTSPMIVDGVAAAVVIGCTYVVGTTQLAAVLDLTPAKAIAVGVLPFIGPDVVKAAVAVAAAIAIRRARGGI